MQLDAPTRHAFAREPAGRILDAGLAIARRARGWTFIVLPAPVVAIPVAVAAWRAERTSVAWSSPELSAVGAGVAYELRGRGASRFTDVIAAASRLELGAIVGADRYVPRLFGGAAFATGSADDAPWTGFGDAWFVLPRWTYSSGTLVLAVDASAAQHAERWWREHARFRAALAAPPSGSRDRAQHRPPIARLETGDLEAWRAGVSAITDAIARGECTKIVTARRTTATFAGELHAAEVLAELDARHADCTRVLMRPPGAATLMAATPERLVRVDGRDVCCDALAGSRARCDAGDATALLASTKDRREHALVVDAIAAALRGLGAEVRVAADPGIRALRHVLHLHTPIAATLPARRHVLEIAAALHPTPAVGGTPARIAAGWIAAHEEPRGWYAAPVGWFDLDGNGELAVAIRAGLIEGNRGHVWAGAGIVAGSDPDRELAETDVKLRAMLGALGALGALGVEP